jgi:hypothetical protein
MPVGFLQARIVRRVPWRAIALGTLLLTGCSKDTPTTPSTGTTVAPPSVTETWENTLAVGGTRFYSFPVSLNGTVNVTLSSLREGGADSAAQVSLGVGVPAGTGCSANTPTGYSAGADPQLSSTYSPGIYCVKIGDPGNLTTPAAFRIVIAHP